jgi:hypothetical protein
VTTAIANRRPFSPELGDKVTVDRTSLQMSDELTFDEWVQLGRQLTEVGDSMAWWVGDWIEQGTVVYGGKYEQALNVMPFEYATLRDYAYVARKFSELSRRIDNLSWGHHQVVAALDAAHADMWLGRAGDEGWTVRDLREHLRASRALPADDGTRITLEQLRFTVPTERAERWKQAADRAGVSFEEWCADTLDEAASG